jgi:alpha-tubulin suppressor-like RCC1 family protein
MSIVAINGNSCAIRNGGALCWGKNNSGQIGNGTTTDSSEIYQVTGLDSGVTAIDGGWISGCAVINGAAKCWGSNYYGNLGDATNNDSFVPVQVKGLTSGVTAISVGYAHACAVVDGRVYCWGANTYGTLGNNTSGTSTHSNVPVQVQGLTSGATAVSCGTSFSCAIVNGRATCWGRNDSGQLGDGTAVDSVVPITVALP